MKKIMLIILIVLSSIALADYAGNITIGNIATGLTGNTVAYCNSTSQCGASSLSCYLEYDNSSSSNYYGICNATSLTNCYNNGTAYSTGISLCSTGYMKVSCSSGAWLQTDCSASNQTCSSSNCTASSTSSSSGGGSVYSTITYSISITKNITDFELIKNSSVNKTITIKNNGNGTLTNITLEIGGYSWYNISTVVLNLSQSASKEIPIEFYAPDSAEIKNYYVSLGIKNSKVSVSNNFQIKIILSNATIENTVKPSYEKYSEKLKEIESNITLLLSNGYDTSSTKSSLNSLKSKIAQLKSAIDSGSYVEANNLISDIESIILDLNDSIAKSGKAEKKTDFALIGIVIVIAIIAVALAYLFWPEKEEIGFVKGEWKPPKKR